MAHQPSDTALQVGSGTATLAAITGAAALVLAILGLNEILPYAMMEIATLLVGAGLMIEGSALTARYAEARAVLTAREQSMTGTGVSAELLGGAATVVLGVLALVGVAPLVVVPAAAIVAGGAMLIGSASTDRTRLLAEAPPPRYGGDRREVVRPDPRDEKMERATRSVVEASTGAEILVGIGAVILGILALLDIQPLTLSLVAMLALGAAILLGGGAIGARLAALLSRTH